jgi:hypothetical protein
VFDGEDRREDAIHVLADGVSVENLTARHFTENGVYWSGVDGFAGRYLTVHNVGLYGIYAIASRGGIVEDSLVSGAADAAFYIGECQPCDTTIRRVIALRSAIGYSGTNASGGMVLRDSAFELNGTGIMPNSYNEEDLAPQGSMEIVGNLVQGSGQEPTPNSGPLGGFHGIGIAVAGGEGNLIEGNEVRTSLRYGIALFPTVQRQGPPWLPRDNVIRANVLAGAGAAELAVSAGSAAGNCFEDNDFQTSLPERIELLAPCPVGLTEPPYGDPSVAQELFVTPAEALARLGARPNYADIPAPPPEPSMPGAEVVPSGYASVESNGPLWPWVVAVGAMGALAAGLALRQRRRVRAVGGPVSVHPEGRGREEVP